MVRETEIPFKKKKAGNLVKIFKIFFYCEIFLKVKLLVFI